MVTGYVSDAIRAHPRWREPRRADEHDHIEIAKRLNSRNYRIVSVRDRSGRSFDKCKIAHVDPENGNAYFVSGGGKGGQQVQCITLADQKSHSNNDKIIVGAVYHVNVTGDGVTVSRSQRVQRSRTPGLGT
jgi:hypothetical protein